MFVETYIALLGLAALGITLLVRWADSYYQEARKEQRRVYRQVMGKD